MKLFKMITVVITLLLMAVSLSSPQPVKAADVRTGNDVIISNQPNLKDLYLFGSTIQLNAPVTNDVVAAGGNVDLNDNITNDVLATGGTITIRGKIGNTVRVAGGNITIEGPITHDLVVAGGTVNISKKATVSGDLMVAGGQVNIEGPVHGKILVSGGKVTLNSIIDGSLIGGEIGTLTLGPQAEIKGNLSYSSSQPAQMETGSIVAGNTSFHRVTKNQKEKQEAAQSAIGAAIYKLIIDIILTLLLIYFFQRGLLTILATMQGSPWKSLGIGFAYAVLAPLASLILLILIWLGIASFLSYTLILLISVFLAKVFIGWWIMRWWENREKRAYMLDWKAGIIGPIVLFILLLIPVLGWLLAAILFLIAIGAFVTELVSLIPHMQGTSKKSKLN